MLSGFVHPGPEVCEAYLDAHGPPVFRLAPKTIGDPATWLFHTCCVLTWAARAADCLDRSHHNRSFLRDAARQLGIPLRAPTQRHRTSAASVSGKNATGCRLARGLDQPSRGPRDARS